MRILWVCLLLADCGGSTAPSPALLAEGCPEPFANWPAQLPKPPREQWQPYEKHHEDTYAATSADGGKLLCFDSARPHRLILPAGVGAGFSLDAQNYSSAPLRIGLQNMTLVLKKVGSSCTLIFDGQQYQLSGCLDAGPEHGE